MGELVVAGGEGSGEGVETDDTIGTRTGRSVQRARERERVLLAGVDVDGELGGHDLFCLLRTRKGVGAGVPLMAAATCWRTKVMP